MTYTYTYALVPVSEQTYNEIKELLLKHGYEHAIIENGVIDMHGLALTNKDDELRNN